MRRQLSRLKLIATKLNIHYARSTPEEALSIETEEGMWHFYYKLGRHRYA